MAGTETSQAAVLPLVEDEANQRLLASWLDDHDTFSRAEPASPLAESEADVCVLDEGGLERNVEALKRLKASDEPVLLPYLLLVPEPGSEFIELEGGDLVETILTRQVDEFVTLPIEQAELQWRIESLLRLREQTLQARDRQRTLEQYERAVEGSTEMLAAADRDNRLLFANERYRWFHGISTDDVGSVTVQEIVEDGKFETVEPRIERVLDGEEIRFEAERTDPAGEPRTLDVRYYPLEDEAGDVMGSVVAMRDVTDREERKRELGRQVDLFAKAQDIADVGAWEYDVRTEEGWWTDEVSRIHGLPLDTEANPPLSFEHYHPEDREKIETAFERAVANGESYDLELRLVDADGDQRWVRTRGEPQYEDGELVRVRGTIQDVTDQKERERELRRTQRAVEASGYGIYITDDEGCIEYVNPAFEEITGYEEAEALGETAGMLASGDRAEDYYAELWETVGAGDVWEEEIVNSRKDGTPYHARQTIAPLTTEGGDVDGYVAIQSDITEQVEAEQELATFKRIVQRLGDPIMLQDLEGRFRVLNEAVATYADMSVEELQGRDEYAFMDERTATEIARQKDRVVETERQRTYEVEPRFPTMGANKFKTTRYPHYDEAGELDGTVAICRDVTDIVDRERQLAAFDHVMRHNIRTELTIIQGEAGHVAKDPTDDSADHARRIQDAAASLQRLAEKQRRIVDVLTDPGDLRPIALRPVLTRVVSAVTDEHPDSEVQVDCPADYRVRALVVYEEALYEVVENAVAHQESAAPQVTVSVDRENDDVNVSVADTGPGLPEVERKVLEGDADIEPLIHGSGLGLWLVNHVVTESGGSLRFRENDPRGSVVELQVPAADSPNDEGD